jgi:hypothetical protein
VSANAAFAGDYSTLLGWFFIDSLRGSITQKLHNGANGFPVTFVANVRYAVLLALFLNNQ